MIPFSQVSALQLGQKTYKLVPLIGKLMEISVLTCSVFILTPVPSVLDNMQ